MRGFRLKFVSLSGAKPGVQYLCRLQIVCHARKIGQTNRRLRHQHHCGEVSELSAHALLYPYFRAGDLWYRHGHLCPHSAGAYAADDGHGVELLPLFGQGRGGRGRRSGRQTQAFRHDMGRYVARRRGVLRACRFVPQRRRGADGRGLCRASRICGLGGAYHPLRRLGLHPLLAAARAGTGAAVRRHQGAERGDERRVGGRFRRRRAFRYGIRCRLGFCRQPDRQRRDVAGHSRHCGPHRAQDQLGAAGRGLRLFAASAGRRTGGYGQRVHRPAADQIPRARRSHGAGRHLWRHYEDRRGDDALLPDVPAPSQPSRSSCRISRSRISCR